MARLGLRVVQARDHLEAAEHSQVAVVAAARSHRVDVGSDHYRQAVLAVCAQPDDVADPIDRDLETELAHPPGDQIAACLVLVCQGEAAHPTAVDGSDTPQDLEAAQQPASIDAELIIVHGLPPGASGRVR